MSKEMWIAAYEELLQAALEDGKTEAEAQQIAENGASGHAYERMADHADYLRKRAKEES